MSITSLLRRNLSNIPGWRSKRKILVLESDDWGSIRMPSRETFEWLKNQGVNVNSPGSLRYNLNDTLASSEDLAVLFESLGGIKDATGNPLPLTAVSLVANPDFEKIRKNHFEAYFYEPFTRTLERYYPNENTFQMWKDGISNGLFIPQFHGREHLQVGEWMRALQANHRETRTAFEKGVWGFTPQSGTRRNLSFQAAFDLFHPDDLEIQRESLRDGLELFQGMHGYSASFFVPPNGPFSNQLEPVAAQYGVKYISAAKIQKEPLGNGKSKTQLHWLGQKNKHKQIYLVRNCFFEPSQGGTDWVKSCLEEIDIAFHWRKPAIISSHRVNYIGVHDKRNRAFGIQKLKSLMHAVLDTYPDVEFMTSDQLGELIKTGISSPK